MKTLAEPRHDRQPAAAATVNAEFSCGQCGTTNEPSRKFCGGCGQNLWSTCPACKKPHPRHERFCGECGVNLAAIEERRLAIAQQRLEDVRESIDTFDFAAAQKRLQALAGGGKDDLPVEHSQAAATMLTQVSKANRHWELAAAAALEAAREALARRDYRSAAETLGDVPEPLRTKELSQLLAEATAQADEVTRLNTEIRTAIADRRFTGLGARIDRLQQLQPDDSFAASIASQLRDRLFTVAKKKFGEDDCAACLRLLDEVPTSVRDEEVEKLARVARELEWLNRDIEQSPAADATLLALAQRVVQLRPQNEAAKLRLQEISAALKRPLADPRDAAPAWRPAHSIRFGFPIQWLAGLRRIGCSAEIDKALRAAPGRGFVACGLALQGIEQAAVPLNLLPQPERGLLGKLPLLRKKTAVPAAWGLDIGSTGICAVRLSRDASGAAVALDRIHRIEHSQPLSPTLTGNQRGEILAESLKQLHAACSPGGEPVIAGLSGRVVLGRFFPVPPLEPKKLDAAIRLEAASQVPIALDELSWGYHLSEPDSAVEGSGTMPRPRIALMQAARRSHVEELQTACQTTGWKIDAVQSDCLALHNFAAFELLDQGQSDADPSDSRTIHGKHSALALLEVGAQSTNLVISGPGVVWFRNLNIGGDQFTNSLVRPLQLTREQAEQIKQQPARAKQLHRVYAEFEPHFAALAGELDRSLELFAKSHPRLRIERLFGLGGGFAIHGLLASLLQPR